MFFKFFFMKDEAKAPELTERQAELLEVIKEAPAGRVTIEDAAYLMRTSPQAVGKMFLKLSSLNLAHRHHNELWPG